MLPATCTTRVCIVGVFILLRRLLMKPKRKWRENFRIKNCHKFFFFLFIFCSFTVAHHSECKKKKRRVLYVHVVCISSVKTCSDFKALIYLMTNIKITEIPCSQMTYNESHWLVVNNKLTLGLRFSTSFPTRLPIYCLVCIHFRLNLITFSWTVTMQITFLRYSPEMHRTEWKKTAFSSASFA